MIKCIGIRSSLAHTLFSRFMILQLVGSRLLVFPLPPPSVSSNGQSCVTSSTSSVVTLIIIFEVLNTSILVLSMIVLNEVLLMDND